VDVACYAMTTQQALQLVTFLKEKNIQFDTGLTDHELLQIQQNFDVVFPPDLKLFLQTGLPVSESFPNWRKALNDKQTEQIIFDWLEDPLSGILFDIEQNVFWAPEWGQLPDSLEQRFSIAKQNIKKYPKLIPIFSHRYISGDPNENDNPVYSVYQTDIIYYGYNLATYLSHQFNFKLSDNFQIPDAPKTTIKFWSDIAS